jgi:hypothetical protein
MFLSYLSEGSVVQNFWTTEVYFLELFEWGLGSPKLWTTILDYQNSYSHAEITGCRSPPQTSVVKR